jgi:hypothetical protein
MYIWRCFNPFIYISPSKLLVSSGFWFTLHNCEIYYLSAVTIILIPLLQTNFHQDQDLHSGRAYSSFLNKFFLSGSLFTLRPYPIILAEVTIYPAALSHNISRCHHLPYKIYALFWLVSRPLFTPGHWVYAMIYHIREQVYKFLPRVGLFYRTPAGYTAKEKTRRKGNRGYQGLLFVAQQPSPPLPPLPTHAPRACWIAWGRVIRTRLPPP